MIEAVVFDVGGVLLSPDANLIAKELREAEIGFGPVDARRAHYRGIYEVDDPIEAEFWPSYATGYLRSIGVEPHHLEGALTAMEQVWRLPATTSWSHLLPEAAETLDRLSNAGIPMAIVSNADGTIEQSLVTKGLCQVGPGHSPTVAAIIDSAVVGWAKPDPRIFEPALRALGVAAECALYVGDSERIDVYGAKRAGLHPVHLDPYSQCRNPRAHEHIASLGELDELIRPNT